jgi:hypothetical protein
MFRRRLLALIGLVSGFSSPTPAKEATLTQMGTRECSVTSHPAEFICPTITLPESFASVTAMILNGCAADGACYGRNYVEYLNLSDAGFNPQLLMGGNFDWRHMELAPRKILGIRIAVRTRLWPVAASAATLATSPSTPVTALQQE